MSVNSKMKAIADLVRMLTGESGKMGLDAMASNLGAVVSECDTQAAIVQQIKTALADKAAGGVELPTLTNPGTAEDLRAGKQLIDQEGNVVTGTALVAGGGFVFPDGAFAPVTQFTDGKQYALVAVIDGVRRFVNTTAYNNYTMNATQIGIEEDAGDYVLFDETPALFTAVASGNGFLLQNGSNYLHGTTSGGTALRVGTTQAVWAVDTSETGGFADGKYYPKADANAVWLKNTNGGYDWSIKYETAGSFGYDRAGRDNTYSTGFVSFVLYEYVAGEGEINPVVDTSDATATAGAILKGETAYVNGRKVTGTHECAASGGSAIKTGTTTSGTINTGLSEIEEFFLFKESVTATGLIHLHYTKTATSRMYASAWSTQNYGTKTITNGTGGVTVNGGTITISATQAAQGALTSNVTYKWTAIGKE